MFGIIFNLYIFDRSFICSCYQGYILYDYKGHIQVLKTDIVLYVENQCNRYQQVLNHGGYEHACCVTKASNKYLS